MRYSSSNLSLKKYIIISLVVMSVICLCIVGYTYIKRLKDPITPAIKAIPESSVCLVEIRNVKELWKHIYEKNKIWKELQCLEVIQILRSQLYRADSLTSIDINVSDVFSKNPLYIAWVPDKGVYKYLFAINLSGPHEESTVINFIEKHLSSGNSFAKQTFLDYEIYEIRDGNKILFAYTVYQGIFIAGETSNVVESSLSALVTDINIEDVKPFSKLNSMSGKNVDANVFVNMAYFDNLLGPYSARNKVTELKFMSLTTDMICLDLTVKNEELLFNGYSLSSDTNQLLRKVYNNQSPQEITLTKICPYNTAVFFFWGMSNTEKYVQDFIDYQKTNFHKRSFKTLCSFYDTTYNTNISLDFLNNIGNEFAFVITENSNIDEPYRNYAIFKANDIKEIQTILEPISGQTSEHYISEKDTFLVKKFYATGFLRNFFGRTFQSLDSSYYTIINNYVIFGESPFSLTLFISGYLSGKTLDKNENYKSFSNNVSEKANFCFYANIRKSFNLILSLLNPVLKNDFDKNRSSLINFQAVAFQFSNDGNKYYLNGYIKHNASYIEENPAIWEFFADSTIYGKASVIFDPTDSSKKIALFDLLGNMYLLSKNGELLWKKHVGKTPLSSVFVVTLKNQKSYLAFNTKDEVFFINIKGTKSDFSPFPLPFEASTGMNIIDFDKNQNSRFIIPCKDKKIYNYSITGKQTIGWKDFSTQAILQQPIELIKIGNKEFLIATDKNGRNYFLDKNGKEILKTKQAFLKAKNSSFYIYTERKKQYLLTSDRKGKLIFISPNGSIDIVTLNLFSENHYFFYGDFNNDGQNDFILFDKGKVYVYNHLKKKIFETYVKNEPDGKPIYIRLSKNKFYIIYPVHSCKSLAFLNNLGFNDAINYTIGSSKIEVSFLFGDSAPSLIVSDSSKLLNYIVE
ncbi:MAG: hypothetical protein WCQ95_05410 [Bacteroidota bacterium]